MVRKKIIYLPFIGFFLFAQSIFLSHQLDHFENTNHSESCFICVLESSSALNLSQDVASISVLNVNLFLKKPSLVFVTKKSPSQFLPRSPPFIRS